MTSRGRDNLIGIAALLSLLWNAEACSFTKNYGSGNGLDSDGVEGFNSAAGAATACTITCDSGSSTSLYLRYGGSAGLLFHDASDFSISGCDISLNLQSDSEEYELGFALSVSGSYTNLVLQCQCTQPGSGGGNPDDGFGCFSEDATVQVMNTGTVAMKDLNVGDVVLTGNNQYQPVYSFGHHHKNQAQEFLQIYTQMNSNTPLEMTKDHLIFASSNGQERAVRADALQPGDRLIHATKPDQYTTITKITGTEKQGVYMPLTLDGTIAVNGLKASTYISLSEYAPLFTSNKALFGLDSEQVVAHWWLSPMRMLCMGVSSKFCDNRNLNDQRIMNWMAVGSDFVHLSEQQNFFVRVVLMGVPLFVTFALLNLLEQLAGPSLAPTAMALLVAWLLWSRRRRSTAGDLPSKKQLYC